MKRRLSFLLSVLLLLSLCPTTALAADRPPIEILADPSAPSALGEQSVSWTPASLSDAPLQDIFATPAPTPAEEIEEIALFAIEAEEETEAAELSESGASAEAGIALAAEEDETLSVLAETADDGSETTPTEEEVYTPNLTDGSCYDPRVMSGITVPIRDQGTLSTCWAMAAISCAELNGLKKTLLVGTPNLSEWHLDYFAHAGFLDPLGNANGDCLTDAPFEGGNPYLSVMTLASWVGPADETKTNTAYENLSRLQSLSPSISMQSELHLENASWLSMRWPEDWAVVKEHIRSRGAAVLCFYVDYSANYNADYKSYYSTYTSTTTNHEVTVVGWDDNFPAEYFNTTAPADGAWLCRNSGGESFGDGGYFWLSYYDTVLRQSVAASFDYGSADNYDNNYQYDGSAVLAQVSTAADSLSYANVFTAAGNPDGHEELCAIATYSHSPSIAYSYEIYLSLDDPLAPDSGTLAAAGSGIFDYAGYHSIRLPEPIALYAGQSFAVIFNVEPNEAGNCEAPVCSTMESWCSINQSEAGESFLWWNGKWFDLSAPSDAASGSNIRIKAFTQNKHETLRLTLDAAGGTPATQDYELIWGTIPAELVTSPTLEGYDFEGWESESGALFDPEARLFESLSLRALWLRSWNDPFSDVTNKSWYYGNVRHCYRRELLLGQTDTIFGSNDNATRAQIVTILYRLAGEPDADAPLDFDDVEGNAYFAKAVRWAAQEDIVLGSDDDGNGVFSFRPYEYVSRQDFLVMLCRFAAWLGEDIDAYGSTDLSSFDDIDAVAPYALAAEKWSVGRGLQLGSNNCLMPQESILRCEMAALLSRFDGYEAE